MPVILFVAVMILSGCGPSPFKRDSFKVEIPGKVSVSGKLKPGAKLPLEAYEAIVKLRASKL
jgi:hypothetical protein